MNDGEKLSADQSFWSSLTECIKTKVLNYFCKDDASSSSENANKDTEQIKILRLLRSELIDMMALIERAKTGKIQIARQEAYFKETKEEISFLIKGMNDLDQANQSDTIRHIHNIWQQMEKSEIFLESFQNLKTEEILEEMTLIEEQAREIILYVGYRTIPDRVNRWLEKTRPGYIFPFHLVFEDELSSEKDRIRVLNYISWKPTAITHGLVDPGKGLIYRYPANKFARILRAVSIAFMFPILVFLVGDGEFLSVLNKMVGGTILDSENQNLPQLDVSTIRLYLVSLFAGIYVHVLIDRNKEQQTTGRPSIMPLSEWTAYLSSRTSYIIYRTLLGMVVFLALIFGADKIDSLTYIQFFLAGYGMDSVLDAVTAKLEKGSTSQFSSSSA